MNTTRAAGRAARPEPKGIPLARYGEAEEIASVVLLAGPAPAFSGQTIQVNGGQMMF
jgi:NAD(P)-dependent dehydrogenase (short-subunit alcohol dehydrogenase family)